MNNTGLKEMGLDGTTATLESQPASNKAATSTPNEIDFKELVRKLAADKRGQGVNISKGNGLFDSACQLVKSQRHINRKDRLPELEATKIRNECDAIITECLAKITANNFASQKINIVRRGGLPVEKVTLVGYNHLNAEKQVFECKLKLKELRIKKDKLELEYKDTDAVTKQIDNWEISEIKSQRNLDNLKALNKA